MRGKTNFLGETAIAAIAGALIVAATPAFAAPASQPQAPSSAATMQAPASSAAHAPAALPGSSAKSTMGETKKASADEPVTKVNDPQTTLASAQVQDESGKSIGTVAGVQTSKSGEARSVKVSLTGTGSKSKIVAIKATKLRYAPTTHMLKARLTREQIQALPEVQTP